MFTSESRILQRLTVLIRNGLSCHSLRYMCVISPLLPSTDCLISSYQTITAGVSGHASVVNVGGDHITHNHDGLVTAGKSLMCASYTTLNRLL